MVSSTEVTEFAENDKTGNLKKILLDGLSKMCGAFFSMISSGSVNSVSSVVNVVFEGYDDGLQERE
jgi:hypothetical protein